MAPHAPSAVPLTPPAGDPCARHVACVASTGVGAGRRRKDERLAAVLSEFGWSAHVADAGEQAALGEERLAALAQAGLVVCDIVRPEHDVPVELAVAATRGIPVLVLMPEGVAAAGLAAEMLDACAATIVRYARVEPHRALHERFLAAGS